MLDKIKKVQWWKIIVFVLMYLAFVFICREVLMVAIVDGASMEDTLHNEDILICRRTTNLKHGDIVTFKSSKDNENLIKRVIALGGDTVKIENNKVYVNNKKIDEPYIKSRMVTNDYKEIKVQEGYVFVLGDNRNNSLDSRYESVGLVNVDEQVSGIVKTNLTKIFKSNTVVKAFALFLIFLFAVVVDIILNIKPKKGEDDNVSGIEDRGRENNNP